MLFLREYGQPGTHTPVVIALHGDTAAAGEMAPVARRLAPDYRVIEPFRRDHPASPPAPDRHIEDLHDVVLARASIDAPPALIGTSHGAVLALLYASTHPEWAGPLVLIGIGPASHTSWNLPPLHLEGPHLKPLVRIQAPVLLVDEESNAQSNHQGNTQRSTIPGSTIYRRLRQYLPQIEYCELPRCGSTPWNSPDTQEEFFSILSGWLRETLQPQAL